MLHLYNLNKVKIKGLKLYKDYCIESTLSTGDKVLSFLYPSRLAKEVMEECYIRTKKDEFVIKETVDRGDWKSVKATLNVEDLEGQVFEHFNTTEQTIEQCLTLAVAGTGWTVQVNGVTKRRTIRKTNCSTWDIIQQAKKTYLVEIEFDTINKVIKVAYKLGSDKGVYFMDSLNLRSLDIQSNSYEFYTRLIAIGKGDLKVTVENYQYSSKKKTLIWKDERYTDINSLTEDATAKLNEVSKPYRAYGANVIDLANMSNKYSILSYSLGDTITLISKEKGVKEKQRIVKITEYPEEPERNSCEIANTIVTFPDIQKEYQEAAETVKNITSDNGTISEGAIKVAVEQITINKADIQDLNAVTARIGTLEATTITTTIFNAEKARINDLIANTVTIIQLNAASARIEILEGKVGSFDTLVAGNLSAKNMQAGFITVESGLIANGAIKNAMILDLSADKINAGKVNTNLVTIQSSSGNMLISDNTIQIKDSTRVRVQIGKDASNDYNMYVWDSNGNLMFDATGLKASGIKNKIIRDDMVSDTANINGTKLNINSVVTSINGATTLLKASKINLDTEAQTLDLAFTSLKSTVTNTSNTVSTQGTAIGVIQGQISNKIWQQDITNSISPISGKVITLESNYSTLNQTVGGITATVNSLQTTTNDLGTRVSSTESSITALNNSITSKVSSSDVTNMINADKTILDTRSSNQPPSWYWTNYPKKTVMEFKYRTTINAPGTTTYGSLTTTVPWSDSSGGSISQVFRSLDGTYERVSTSTTAWSTWKELEDTKGSQDKINAYNTSTVAPLISRVSTAESSITQLNNSIKLKVSQTDVETYVNDIFVATKNTGIELINQDYQKGISIGFPFSGASVIAKVDGQIGGFGMKGTVFSTSNYIPFDVTKPIYVQFDFYSALRTTGRLYIGFEFYTAEKVSMGANNLCYYVINKAESDIPTGSWQRMDAWLPELTTDTTRNTSKYVKVRILTRYSIGDTTNWTYFKNFSVKQLGGQHLNDTITRVTTAESSIEQMAGQISSKVAVNDLSSLIRQRPNDVLLAFNNSTTSGLVDIKNGNLRLTSSSGRVGLELDYDGTIKNHWGVWSIADAPIYDGTFKLSNANDKTLLRPWGLNHAIGTGGSEQELILGTDYGVAVRTISGYQWGRSRMGGLSIMYNTERDNAQKGLFLTSNEINGYAAHSTIWLNYTTQYHTSSASTRVGNGWGSGGLGELVCGDFSATGSKNSIQKTENYGWRKINAYETAEYYFGDIGSGILMDGKCYIWIEDVFSETVNTEINYHVFLTKYGPGDIWVSKRTPSYIIVEGNIGLEFSWEIKAKRKGYETSRLEDAKEAPVENMDFKMDESDEYVLDKPLQVSTILDEANSNVLNELDINSNSLMEECIV